ncbi:MAG: glycosyltransferase family 1 protein [Candidatus Omnitrophica bacterium]|nr:glycosyltransferase family 1 protein [Candidatus Omnitrophota bacterium]
MRLAVIYDLYREDTLGEHYRRALLGAGCDVSHFWLKDAARINPEFDAYLRVDDGDYKYDIPHRRLAPSFFYASDTHLKKPFEAIKRIARSYDHVFCAQYRGYVALSRAHKGKVSWLPHASDEELHKDLNVRRELDVAFVGNDGGIPRKFLLQEIRERFPNSYIGNASYNEIAGIYSRARIGFNYSIADDINMRCFEIMACGAALLTNRIGDEGFNILFDESGCIAVYDSPRDIFSKIEYYLRNDDERARLARGGKGLALEHTYKKRALSILGTIKKYLNGDV